jgi:alkaline phosphatase D
MLSRNLSFVLAIGALSLSALAQDISASAQDISAPALSQPAPGPAQAVYRANADESSSGPGADAPTRNGLRKLASGPMIGHTTARSSSFWLLLHKTETVRAALYRPGAQEALRERIWSTDTLLRHGRYHILRHYFGGLEPQSEYIIRLWLDGEYAGEHSFRTFAEGTDFDFSFLTGSCAMRPPQAFRMFFPGPQEAIYPVMTAVPSDFMLWLGDNVYYLLRHMNVPEMMYERRIKKAQVPEIRDFMRSRPMYAIWDDHDFGPNNQKGNFALKDTSLFIHNHFWVNPYHGTRELKGIFTHFSLSDADFILLDNRYHSTPHNHPNPAMIGAEQMQWLKERLLESKGTFRFIAVGSQVLNLLDKGESWQRYPQERREILDFIAENNIKNVIFLTGDRHHTELQRVELKPGLPVYDFTCSPLTSATHQGVLTGHEAQNPQRIPGTLLAEHNFGRVSLSGAPGVRQVHIEVFNAQGQPVWDYTIAAQP